VVALSAVALTACETPRHSNTLIFGTNTKVALDVSADQIKQTPSVTVGYTRQEAVWMPLMPNVANEEGKLIPCTENAQSESCKKFVGTGTGEQDTYSVLATFGADFSGGAETNTAGTAGASASGGIAQYFATGLAARILADRGGARLVSVRSGDSEANDLLREQERARLGISENQVLKAELSQRKAIDSFMKKCAPGGIVNKSACTALVKKSSRSAGLKDVLSEEINTGSGEAVRVELNEGDWSAENISEMLS
jgi:hypothetical protein